MAELVTLVDERDKIIGTKDRDELQDSDRWRAVTIWIENNGGKILLAKRGPQKKFEPNLWEPGASGTVTHPENYEVSAQRELEEEVGIHTDGMKLLKVLFYKKPFGSRAMGIFKVVVANDIPIKLQEDEVADSKWVTKEELTKDYANNPEGYVSDFKIMINQFLDE